MNTFKPIATIILSGLTLLSSFTYAASYPVCSNMTGNPQYYCSAGLYSTQQSLSMWNSFTPRQKNLSTAVSNIYGNYRQQTGKNLPITTTTISQVMVAIGATASERNFVISRMQSIYNASSGMSKIDNYISSTARWLSSMPGVKW